MRRIAFTEAEILQLTKERIENEHPIVRRAMVTLYMKAVLMSDNYNSLSASIKIPANNCL